MKKYLLNISKTSFNGLFNDDLEIVNKIEYAYQNYLTYLKVSDDVIKYEYIANLLAYPGIISKKGANVYYFETEIITDTLEKQKPLNLICPPNSIFPNRDAVFVM